MQPSPSDEAIRDTIAAVFRQPAYDRSVRETLWDQFWAWLKALLAPVAPHVGEQLADALLIAAAALVVLLLLRFGFLVWLRRERIAIVRGERQGRRGRGRDPWRVAQEEAAHGNFTEAAHALYSALLLAMAHRERVRLDPSKTIGDYARELRARSSDLFGRFRDFARSYERVIYGIGRCDRERYEQLHALAAPIVRPEP